MLKACGTIHYNNSNKKGENKTGMYCKQYKWVLILKKGVGVEISFQGLCAARNGNQLILTLRTNDACKYSLKFLVYVGWVAVQTQQYNSK